MAKNSLLLGTSKAGAFCGLLVGLFDAFRAIALTQASAGGAMAAILISSSIGALGGAVLLPAIFLLLGQMEAGSFDRSRLVPELKALLGYLGIAIPVLSVFALLTGRAVLVLGPGFHYLIKAALGLLGIGVISLVLQQIHLKIPRANRPGVLPAIAVSCSLLAAGILIIDKGESLSKRVDAGGESSPRSTVPEGSPNILLIVLDAVRADHLSLYGYPRETSPFLSEFARECTVYDRAISPAPWTLPSHASLFTGLPSSIHQATTEHRILSSEFRTVAEILKEQGYDTAGFSANPIVGKVSNLQQGFDNFYDTWRPGRSQADPVVELMSYKLFRRISRQFVSSDKGSRRTNRLVRAWLTEREQKKIKRPFFVFINYLESHLPYTPPEPQRSRFLREPLQPAIRALSSEGWLPIAFRLMGAKDSISPEGYRQLAALYDGEIAYLDACLKDLVMELKRKNLMPNTCIIITSDHGENLGDHGGLLDHCLSIHQSLLHVPLLVRYPKIFPMGTRYPAPVGTVAIFSTILSLLSSVSPDVLEPAAAPLPLDPNSGGYPFVISEYGLPLWQLSLLASQTPGVDVSRLAVRQKSIQNAYWKLIRRSDGTGELYDLSLDPHELTPLDPSRYETGQELQARLDNWLSTLRPPTLEQEKTPHPQDRKALESLRSLGYIH